ncbi:MAG TPA: Lpg1974 family pore-forming outer membrane protein [Pirellulales bacterium]|nr:Lpg1974 family pore-forming outer membrane protein [Pirellulales bacterium]
MRKGTDVKTVIFTATTVAALLCVGHPLRAQQQSPPVRQWMGATLAGKSSQTAADDESTGDDDSIADDESTGDDDPADDENPSTASPDISRNVHGYRYASHPGKYDPWGQGSGQMLGSGQMPGDVLADPADDSDAPYTTGAEPFAAYGSGDDADNTAQGGNPACCGDGCRKPCCSPFWAHRNSVFAEMLYLRPRGADVAYAEVRNGTDPATAVPFGQVATVSPNYSIGYRAGFTKALNRCTSIVATYTYFQSETNSSLFANPPLSVHSLVTLPQTYNAVSDSLGALGRYNVRFQFADVDYMRLLSGGDNWALNYTVGTRYANLHEAFREAQPLGPGVTNVASNVNFDGLGTRIGLQGERKARNCGLMAYSKGFASLLVGTFRSGYSQTNNFQALQAMAAWNDSRAVPILEYELGLGWQNRTGRIRISGGYYFAAWFNTVSPNNFMAAVQNNSYANNTSSRSDTVTFDGLTTRAEFRW